MMNANTFVMTAILAPGLLLLAAMVACAQTNVELREGADAALKTADAELNAVYQQLMDQQTESGKEALRTAQRAWITYRDAAIESEGLVYEGGSMQSIVRVQAAVELTRERTQRLKSMFPEGYSEPENAAPAENKSSGAEGVPSREEMEKRIHAWMEKNQPEYRPMTSADQFADTASAQAPVMEALFSDFNQDKKTDVAMLAIEKTKATRKLKFLIVHDLMSENPAVGYETDMASLDDWTPALLISVCGADDVFCMPQKDGKPPKKYDGAFPEGLPYVTICEADAHCWESIIFDGKAYLSLATPDPGEADCGGAPVNAADAGAQKSEPQTQDLTPLLQAFGGMTELQQEAWNQNNQDKHLVHGNGTVSEVNEVNFMSEITDAAYEITCELATGDRAVLFLGKEYRDQVIQLTVGAPINFVGQLKNINDWGFWRSGYVRVP